MVREASKFGHPNVALSAWKRERVGPERGWWSVERLVCEPGLGHGSDIFRETDILEEKKKKVRKKLLQCAVKVTDRLSVLASVSALNLSLEEGSWSQVVVGGSGE
jgi:hypothetical protein